MEKQKEHPNRIFLHDEYLRWEPPEMYVYEELLHFPEIEEEKRIRTSRGDNTMPEHEREKDIPGHHIFYHSDTNEQFDKRNKDLCASRSRIFVSKNGEKGAHAGKKRSYSMISSSSHYTTSAASSSSTR
uniref:Uncharacterized protein n=1 Tax=Panagrolaimus sp. PS1159 TaxID=55785 RepID=A0AC35FX57_9BILA